MSGRDKKDEDAFGFATVGKLSSTPGNEAPPWESPPPKRPATKPTANGDEAQDADEALRNGLEIWDRNNVGTLETPIPDDAPAFVPTRHKEDAAAPRYEYRDHDGALQFLMVGSGFGSRPYTLRKFPNGALGYRNTLQGYEPRWATTGTAPLYNAHLVAERPGASVLFVEDEEAADWARENLPKNVVPVSPAGGFDGLGRFTADRLKRDLVGRFTADRLKRYLEGRRVLFWWPQRWSEGALGYTMRGGWGAMAQNAGATAVGYVAGLPRITETTPERVLAAIQHAILEAEKPPAEDATKLDRDGKPWEPSEPLPDCLSDYLPAMDLDLLPEVVGSYARALAYPKGEDAKPAMDPSAGAVALLAGVGAAGALAYAMDLGFARLTFSNMGCMVVGKVAEGKSAFIGPVRGAHVEGLKKIREVKRDAIVRWELEHGRLTKALEKARTKYEGTGDESDRLACEDLRRELQDKEANRPEAYDWLADNITPATIVDVMARNGGRIFICSGEPSALANISGRFDSVKSGIQQMESVLSGLTNEAIAEQRKGREPVVVEHSSTSMVVGMQPSIFETLQRAGQMESRGLFSRCFMVFMRRTAADAPWPDDSPERLQAVEAARRAYVETVTDLIGMGLPDAWPLFKREVKVSAEAKAVLQGFFEWSHEASRKELAGAEGWALRASENLHRLALVFHLAEHGTRAEYEALSADTAQRAATTMRDYFLPHALFAHTGTLPGEGVGDVELAAKVLVLWKESGRAVLTLMDLRGLSNETKKAPTPRIEAALATLERFHLVHQLTPMKTGGAPAKRWEINPDQLPVKTRTPLAGQPAA